MQIEGTVLFVAKTNIACLYREFCIMVIRV